MHSLGIPPQRQFGTPERSTSPPPPPYSPWRSRRCGFARTTPPSSSRRPPGTRRAGIHAGHGDGHAVRVGPRGVEGGDAAGLAEGVPGRVRAEGVGGDELLGAGLQLEPGGRDDEVGVPAHRAVGAVADPRHDAPGGLDAPAHAPAVAPAGVHDLVGGGGAHPVRCGGGEREGVFFFRSRGS